MFVEAAKTDEMLQSLFPGDHKRKAQNSQGYNAAERFS